MNAKQSIKAMSVMLLIGTIFITGCKKETPSISISKDVDNTTLLTWDNSLEPGEVTLVIEDLSAGIAAQVAEVQEDYPETFVNTIEVASFSLITQDVSNFEYLSALDVFIAPADPSTTQTGNISPRGVLVGTMYIDDRGKASLNLQLQPNDLANVFKNTDEYDLYFRGDVSMDMIKYSTNRVLDVELTFRVLIES